MSSASQTEVEVPVLASSKKQRSARSSGKKGWAPVVSEIKKLVGCSYSANDGFSPHMLVWAKLDGGAWWPAKVVSVDEIPEDLKKQEEGWTCVKYYGVDSTQAFAWLKAEELLPYDKHSEEFSQQSILTDANGDNFKSALIEIQDVSYGQNVSATTKSSSGTTKPQERKILLASSSHNVVGGVKDDNDGIQQELKQRKLKFKGVDRRPLKDDKLNSQSKGKEASEDPKILDRTMDMKRKRKRLLKRQETDSDGDGVREGGSLGSPTKKFGSPAGNSSSLSSRDIVKKSRGKKTGDDGYYFECMVCDMGGDLLCCDQCPRVYHLECLSPPLKRTPPGKWICPVCRETPGVGKGLGAQTPESKPRFKTTAQSESRTPVPLPRMRPGPKRGWKMFLRGKQSTQDLDMRNLRKRKRVEEIERPRKRLNLKRSFPPPTQPKCKQCGGGINSSGESPCKIFCKECAELVKQGNLNSAAGKVSVSRKDMVPTRHSKLKPGKCDICSQTGFVIFCDVCPRGYHKDCLNPPRKRAPKGAWSCPKCGPLKDVKEGKDAREAREGQDGAKEVKASKTGKAPKVVKDIPQLQKDKQEHITATPPVSEIYRILGCRRRPSSISASNNVEPVGDGISNCANVLAPSEDVLKSEQSSCTPVTKSDGKGIEIRLSICDVEQSKGEETTHCKVGPDQATNAPASDVMGAVSPCIDDVRDVSTTPVSSGDKVDAEQTVTAKSGCLDLELGLSKEETDQLDENPSESKAVEGVSNPGKDQESSIRMEGLEVGISESSASKEEESKSINLPSTDTEPDLSKDVFHTEKIGVDISDQEQVDLGSKIHEGNCNVQDHIGFLEPSNEVCGKDEEVALFISEDKAEAVEKDVPQVPLDSAVQPELEFLVKWTGRAHIHNEWVSEELLRGIAKRKLENYKLKHGITPKMLVEDKWLIPQRIVAKRAVPDKGNEVLVKWCGLSYEECTWEHVDETVIVSSSELIKTFDRFEEALSLDADLVDNKADALDPLSLRGRCPTEIETIKEQPAYLKGGSLFAHQMEALNWLRKCWHRQRNVILADEMGLGKTISACSFIASIRHEFKVRAPCLVLVPLSTMPNWLAEFALWAPSLNVIEYHGSAKARALIREYEWHGGALDGCGKKDKKLFKFNVMLTTYEMVIADSSQLRVVPWEVLVVDEGHRLKNSGSKLFTLLNTFSFSHRVLLTGTPLQNNFGEMFNLLNFLQPDTFPSLAAFEEKFSSLSTADQVEELKKLVAPNMLRRLKKDAMQKIPPKTELVVPVDMNSVQIEYYKAVLTRNYQVLKNGGKQQSMLNIVMQLRKVCNHPYLIAGTEPETGTQEFLQEMRIKASAKLMLLHSMLGKLKADGHRVLIFSQMTKLLDILEDYLTFEFGQEAFERVDGSVSVAERQSAIARFNQDTSRFVFLLSTRACGLGINLATADTVIIYDSDFNPQADIQAMNRAHRIGQSKTLLVYRLVVRASVEERILQLAKKKLMLDHLFANKSGSQKEVDDILRWGTEELFQEASIQTDEPSSVSSIPGGVDDGEAKQKKKSGDLGDMYGGHYLQLGRSKVVWDDTAVKRLLDRSDLSTCHPEVTEGEQENDIFGSLKAWDWNEQDVVLEEPEGDEALDVEKVLQSPAPEEESQWDKLLRSRWETLQTEEEAALGRGKRNRKAVSYMESNGQKSNEPLSESSDADNKEDPEPDYTPVGRALKQKMAKLRARQKDRILQRYNEISRTVDGESLVMVTGVPIEGMGLLRNLDVIQEAPLASCSIPISQPSGRVATDIFSQTDLNGNVSGPATSLALVKASSLEGQSFSIMSTSPSIPSGNGEWYPKSKSSYSQQLHPHTGLPTSMDDDGASLKASSNNHQEKVWVGGVAPVTGNSSVMSQIFGRAVGPGDGSHADGVSTISLSTVSQGLESGQSLSQLIPALRQSLQGVQFSNSSQLQAPVDFDLTVPTPNAMEVPTSNHLLQQDSGLSVFPTSRPANGAKPKFNLDDIKSFIGHQYKSKPPDVALEFSQRIFGLEKTHGSSVTPLAGEDSSGQQSTLGTVLPSAIMSGEENSSLKLSRSEYIQGSKVPNLSIALGLQLIDSSPTSDTRVVQDTRSNIASTSSAPLLPGYSTKGIDIQVAGGFSRGDSNYSKLGTKEITPIELNDDEPEPIVNTPRFLSTGIVEGMGRVWHDSKRKVRDYSKQVWTEDELDALWTGVRRHGRGNWAAMLLDSKLGFSKSRTVGELAQRWKEEQMKMFGNPEPLSEAGRQPPSVQSSPMIVTRSEGGLEEGLLHGSSTEYGRASHTSVHMATNRNSESAVVHPDDKFFQCSRSQERKESIPWALADFETKPSKERLSFTGVSNTGGPSTVSGLQLVDKIGESGRLESSRQGSKYHMVDLQSGRSSPSLPTALPGRNGSTSGAVSGSNLGSFGQSSQALGSLFRTGGAFDQIGGDYGHGLSPKLGLGPDWRRQDSKARDRTSWQQQALNFSASDSGKYQSTHSERNSLFRFPESHANVQIPPAPSPRLGSPTGHSVGNKATVVLPYNGAPVSTAEHRRRARGGSSAKAIAPANADDSAPSNLPHWLREAVKARAAPAQPPLPPAIAAVVQATNLLYKDSKRLLPPLVHPGYPMVPPRELPKRHEMKKRRRKLQAPPTSRTEGATVGNHAGSTEFSRSVKIEGLNQPVHPLPLVEGGGVVSSRSLGHVSSSLPQSKGLSDFPLVPGFDHPQQQQIPNIPAGSLSELMARKSLMELGFMPGYNESILNGSNRKNSLNESKTSQGSRRSPLDFRPELDLGWKRSEAQQGSLLPTSSGPLLSQGHFPRNSQGLVFPEAFTLGGMGEENVSDPEKKSQLPQWLLSGENATKRCDDRQKHCFKPDVDRDDDEDSTSSKTVSDPGIRSNGGKNDDNSDDASSEETISDDGTQ